jgi:aromatic-L-amino-acid/L-tryptophan decarboxylase
MRPTTDVEAWQQGLGDMGSEEFREHARRLVDWIVEYRERIEELPVLSRVRPGEISKALPNRAPEKPDAFEAILDDFDRIIMPGITHWNHPSFFAYFSITGSAPGILGEFLSAALNVNGMLWRTSPAATELEETTLGWLRELLGLPASFEGLIYDTASISSLVAIAAAREATGLAIRERGMSGRADLPQIVMYCSEQAHSSIEKAAITLGIGQEGVRKIETDAEYRMDAEALRSAVERDVREGCRPFCVVATVGTTATTSIDPVRAIADVCQQHDLWLHVDAAYAGVAAIVPEMRWVLDAVERADSVVVNPHKWLFTPVDLSAFYSRRLNTVADAFSLVAPYLRTGEDEVVRNYMNYGPQLGRRFRALKLWFVLRSFGREGIIARLREHMRLAQDFAGWVQVDPNWVIEAPTPFSTVVFRALPPDSSGSAADDINRGIEERINTGGEAFIAHTVLRDHVALRLAIGNLGTQERHLRRVWELLQEALQDCRNEKTDPLA